MRRPLHVFRGPIGGAHIQKLNGRLPEGEEEAERNIQPERVQFKCGANVKAEVEYIKEEGQTAGRTRIIRVIEHGYTSDSYDAESKY
jgi:Mg/Co/Ni transporter MgtE